MTTYDRNRSVLTQGRAPTIWDDITDWMSANTWNTTLPQDAGPAVQQGLIGLAKDMTPVEGQRRSAIRSGQEWDKAQQQFREGQYPQAAASTIWSGLEATDAALPALGLMGTLASAPIDAARSLKKLSTAFDPKAEGTPIFPVREEMTERVLGEKLPEGHYVDPRTLKAEKVSILDEANFNAGRIDVTGDKESFVIQGIRGENNILDMPSNGIASPGSQVQTNLNKRHKNHWRWTDAEGKTIKGPLSKEGNEIGQIISVQGSDGHHYALVADLEGGNLWRNRKNIEKRAEPRLRPSTRGDIEKGNVVAYFTTPGGNTHPVYDQISVKPKTTGSMDVRKDVPVTYRGKDISEFSPEDWEAFGKEFGAKRIGPLTQPVQFRYADGEPFEIPGGLDGEFTYYDMLYIKNQGIDPSRIPKKLHAEIQSKIVKSVMPQDLSDAQLFNQMVFGLTSPNNPLFPNELAVSRVRTRSKSDIDRIAKMIPWEPGANVSKEKRNAANAKIAKFFGVQASGKGGLGVRGSADYTNIAELAKMFQKNPKWFRKKDTEGWDDYVERLMSQTRGLSAKTASFAGVWQDPVHAAISAVDRHMAKIFQKKIFKNQEARNAWETKVINAWNKKIDKRADLAGQVERGEITPQDFEDETRNLFGAGNKKVNTLKEMMEQGAGEGHFVDQILAEVSKPKNMAMRSKGKKDFGQVNKNVPENMQPESFVVEPEKISLIGDVYRNALKQNEIAARKDGLGLFASQWMLWDRQRRRMEPHEIMHPELNLLPALSLDQAQGAKQAHRKLGFTNYQKSDDTQQLMPTKPGPSQGVTPSQLATIGLLPPAIAAPLLYEERNQ